MRFGLISLRLVNLMIWGAYLCFKIGDSVFEFNVITFESGIFFILGLLKSRIVSIHDFERLVELRNSICELPILSGKLFNVPLLTFNCFKDFWNLFYYGSRWCGTSWFFATNYADRRGFTQDKIRCQFELITISIVTSLSIFIFWW